MCYFREDGMNMSAEKYLEYLQNEIHSTVFATIDGNEQRIF